MFCKNCGAELTPEQAFCLQCGAAVGTGNTHCAHCGEPVAPGAAVCVKCGFATGTAAAPAAAAGQGAFVPPNTLLQGLSQKVKTEAVIWTAIAAIQVLIGLVDFLFFDITTGIILFVVAILNFVVASRDFKYSREVFERPVGIVAKYQPVGALIGTLVYNLLFGGLIGVVGSIFGFVTRSYVMNNAAQFQALEAQQPPVGTTV